MALFSGTLKKMLNELGSGTVNWQKVASLSSGKYDLSGKNAADGRELVSLLIKKAAEASSEIPELSMIIRNLSSRGGDFNRSQNETGATPVHIAAGLENGFLLKALLEAGIPPVAPSHSGSTALHKAVSQGRAGNVKLLLAAGADPGAEDGMSNSPLHIAARMNGDNGILRLLLEAGAKAYQRNSEGKRPVDLAEESRCAECVLMLRESLKNIRRSRTTQWKCPSCSANMKRPPAEKIEWYMGIEMWEHLRFTCGSCGQVTSALKLDGEV